MEIFTINVLNDQSEPDKMDYHWTCYCPKPIEETLGKRMCFATLSGILDELIYFYADLYNNHGFMPKGYKLWCIEN